MDEILNLDLNDMAQTEFDCSCGRHHNFSIHDVAIGSGTSTSCLKLLRLSKKARS